MRDITPGEQYERTAWSFGPRRLGLRIRIEHANAECLMDMEDEWLRERSEAPVAERVAVVTVFKQQVVAKIALNGSTVFETESVPTTVMVTESELDDGEEPVW